MTDTTETRKPTKGEQLFTLSALCSLLLGDGDVDTITAIGNTMLIRFADDAGVDRAFSSLVATNVLVGIVKDPHEQHGVEARVRTATLCIGGHHVFLEGPLRPVLKAV